MNPLNHVAIIMDGNGRWGKKNKNSRNSGHRQGLKAIEKIIPNEIKIVSILDPPYDINGNGAPTTGNNPDTIPTFTKT